MKDRQPPPQTQQNSCSFPWILAHGKAVYTLIPLCWTKLVGIFIPFHRQESKGQAAQQRQKKAPPFHPSALISMEETGLFCSQIWLQTFIIFLCSPKLLLSQKLSWGWTETQKEATPSLGSLQWNPQCPQPSYTDPTSPPKTLKMSWQCSYSQQLHLVHEVHLILHPREIKGRYIGNSVGIQKPSCSNTLLPQLKSRGYSFLFKEQLKL